VGIKFYCKATKGTDGKYHHFERREDDTHRRISKEEYEYLATDSTHKQYDDSGYLISFQYTYSPTNRLQNTPQSNHIEVHPNVRAGCIVLIIIALIIVFVWLFM
jgi:hypothetical protein